MATPKAKPQAPNPFQVQLVALKVPEGMGTQISIGGFLLDADEDGNVSVPQEYAADLMAQGLLPA